MRHNQKVTTPSGGTEKPIGIRSPNLLFQSNVCPVPVCLLSDVDSAKFLGISRSLIREYADTGKLKVVRLPHPSGVGHVNRTLFDVQDLRRFVSKAKGETE